MLIRSTRDYAIVCGGQTVTKCYLWDTTKEVKSALPSKKFSSQAQKKLENPCRQCFNFSTPVARKSFFPPLVFHRCMCSEKSLHVFPAGGRKHNTLLFFPLQ